ncbi:MBL fold metallo-hydrolase [Flavobacterium sp. WC2509]|uniref:MBL fold metallo-hydrolase n=1 Tax=Flavobacterium sp. WC2509 TaxID=3461406 RepID=UPI004044978D
MNKFFEIEFQFRPVGQGLFYSGVFNHLPSGELYTMVYDCGTNSTAHYINHEIDIFSRKIKKGDKLDLLLISHFHDDHISHVPLLLQKTNGAKVVILPFLSPDELLLNYHVSLIDGRNTFPAEFFIDPARYLMNEFKVDQVIYIHPSEAGRDDLTNGDIDPNKLNFTEDFQFVLENNLQLVTNLPLEVITAEGVSHYYDMGTLIFSGLWEFKFFNKIRDPRQVITFKNDLALLLSNTNPTIEDVRIYVNNSPISTLINLKQLYYQNFLEAHINDTSLVVFHTAITPLTFDYIRSWILGRPYFPASCKVSGASSYRCGNLLVGDIKVDNRCLDQIMAKWSSIITDKVIYSQIPHHGASGYLNPRFFNVFSNAIHHIINFGLGNRNKHPTQSIIDIVQNARPINVIHSNTQLSHVKIRYVIGNNI